MSHDHHHGHAGDDAPPKRAKWVFIGFFLIAGYFLVAEHQAHLTEWLSKYGIWLLLLACPVMHMFMHGGPGGHGGHGGSDRDAGDGRPSRGEK